MNLDNTISAVVTGGASGLGAATARRLAARGVRVALFDLNAEIGEPLARELGGVFCRVDVTSEEQVDAAFAAARRAIGQERVLVNCAGTGNAVKTAGRDKTTGETRHFPLANWERIIQINLIGTFRCIAKSAAGMLTLAPIAGGERGVDRQHRIGGGAGWTGRPVGLQRLQGRHRQHDLADRARSDGRRHPRQHDPAGLSSPLPFPAAPTEKAAAAAAASLPFRRRAGPDELGQLVEAIFIKSGFKNGECIRLGGGHHLGPPLNLFARRLHA